MSSAKRTLEERFWAKVNKDGPIVRPELGPCWIWLGARKGSGEGYGAFCVAGKMARAHRLAWEMVNGQIPDKMGILHRCDVTLCVRLEHLFPGTQLDNTRDMVAKGRKRAASGERHGGSRLKRGEVLEIRSRFKAGEKRTALAPLYGVTVATIYDICSGRSWETVRDQSDLQSGSST